jgi:hypothetical protein
MCNDVHVHVYCKAFLTRIDRIGKHCTNLFHQSFLLQLYMYVMEAYMNQVKQGQASVGLVVDD